MSVEYAQFVIDANDDRWFNFVGKCYLIGIVGSFTSEQIEEYIFETYHSMDIETEVPVSLEKIREDMELYFKE